MSTRTLSRRPRIDTAWFQAQITASRFGGMRPLCAEMRHAHGKFAGRPYQVASLWRLVHGEKPMRLSEARQLADLLGQPFAEVCRRAGIDARDQPDDLEQRYRDLRQVASALLAFIDEHGVKLPPKLRMRAKAALDA